MVTVPEFQHGTLRHFGHVLGAPLLDEGPAAADSAAWPPLTLEYVGATHAPSGTLWRVPSAYRGLLLKVRDAQLEARTGDALAAHLLEFTPRLRASDPQAACRNLVALLADLLELAATESADVYVLTLTGKA